MTYGCFNRKPFKPVTVVRDGHHVVQPVQLRTPDSDRTLTVWPELRAIPFRMTPDCQYTKTTLGQRDPGCVGCKHKETQ